MPRPNVPTPDQPDLADVLVDITVLETRLDDLGDRLALALPPTRRTICGRVVALLADMLSLLDDVASGRLDR